MKRTAIIALLTCSAALADVTSMAVIIEARFVPDDPNYIGKTTQMVVRSGVLEEWGEMLAWQCTDVAGPGTYKVRAIAIRQDEVVNGDVPIITAIGIPRNYEGECVVPDCWDNIPGDADGDGDVDVADAVLLRAAWREYDRCCDFNRDGVISPADAVVLMRNWKPK